MSAINLYSKSIINVLDVDDPKVLIPIEKAIKKLEDNAKEVEEGEKAPGIRTMFCYPTEVASKIEYNYDIAYINKITKQKITNINKDIKYWKIDFKFYNDTPISFVVPGFVKFWSQNNKTFVPVEFMKKSDLLMDEKGDMVQVVKKTELEDFSLEDEEFYSFQINCNHNEYMAQFYLNGILTSIPYNNYLKD